MFLNFSFVKAKVKVFVTILSVAALQARADIRKSESLGGKHKRIDTLEFQFHVLGFQFHAYKSSHHIYK